MRTLLLTLGLLSVPVRLDTPFLVHAARYARATHFTVTATRDGRHNRGSLHYRGLALDVSVRGKSPVQIARFIRGAEADGWRVRDERARPAGQAVWHGAHLHVEWTSKAWRQRHSQPGRP
jgi:hypothetical protein